MLENILKLKNNSFSIEYPTMVLCHRNGKRLGVIENVSNLKMNNGFKEPLSFQFEVYKTDTNDIWNNIQNMMLVWISELDDYFELTVSLEDSDETVKSVKLTHLPEVVFSKNKVYSLEINSEKDIKREDYKPSVLFNVDKKTSILDRVLYKYKNYKIMHVDNSIKNIQRTFLFNKKSIKDCFDEIEKSISCVFIYKTKYINGEIIVEIEVYDLLNYCIDCGYRGEFEHFCPKCDKNNITQGYGEEIPLLIDKDLLAKKITLDIDKDSMVTCYKLSSGDDLMDTVIYDVGNFEDGYFWYFNKDIKNIMSTQLKEAIENIENVIKNKVSLETILDSNLSKKYNDLVKRYGLENHLIKAVENQYKFGLYDLYKVKYDLIDTILYLKDKMFPPITKTELNARTESLKLNNDRIGSVAVLNQKPSLQTINSVVISVAKTIINPNFKIKIIESSLNENLWSGKFSVCSYSDETDLIVTDVIQITITNNYEDFIKHKINNVLNSEKIKDSNKNIFNIVDLFKLNNNLFEVEISKYNLSSLKSFYESCQKCIDVMIENKISSNDKNNATLYSKLYQPYLSKLNILEKRIKIIEDDILFLEDKDSGFFKYISSKIDSSKSDLGIYSFLSKMPNKNSLIGELDLLRVDGDYENKNFLSKGLTNRELVENAIRYIEIATKDIYNEQKSRRKVSVDMNNILNIIDDDLIRSYFKCGNWFRVEIDGDIHKVRLLNYDFNFDNLDSFDAEFSEAYETNTFIDDTKRILDNAKFLGDSYNIVSDKLYEIDSVLPQVKDWVYNGISSSLLKVYDSQLNQKMSYDSSGTLFRALNDDGNGYKDEQLKIINNGLYLTDDNWKTARAGIGLFNFFNHKTKTYESRYGVIADTIASNLVLSKEVNIVNEDGSVYIGENGLDIITKANSKNKQVFSIKKETVVDGEIQYKNQLYIDDNGNIVLGNGAKILWDNVSEPFTESLDTLNVEIGNVSEKLEKFTFDEEDKLNNLSMVASSIINSSIRCGEFTFDCQKPFSHINKDGNSMFIGGLFVGDFIANKFEYSNKEYNNRIELSDIFLFSTTDNSKDIFLEIKNQIYGSRLGINYLSFFDDATEERVFLENQKFKFSTWIDFGKNKMITGSSNNTIIDLSEQDKIIFGGNKQSVCATVIRGREIRLNSSVDGGVFLGESGSVAITSDETRKDIMDLDDRYIDFFKNIKPIKYRYKNGNLVHIGYGARQIKKSLDKAKINSDDFAGIHYDKENNLYSLRYEEFIGLNSMMIQRLMKEVDDLKKEVKDLKCKK